MYTFTPNIYHIEVMLGVQANDSITEIATRTGKSVGTVHALLVELESHGMVNPPRRPNVARDRTLTQEAKNYLLTNGYIPQESVFGT